MILYEYPFNERIRTYLRLEQLFQRLAELLPRTQAVDHHFAIQTLFEILEAASRSDLKTEVLKDLERQKQVFNGYRGNPAIAESVLDDFIERLDRSFNALREEGRIGHALLQDDSLMAIRSRMAIPGGTCAFDLPAYHHWQHQPSEQRQHDLNTWAQGLADLATPVQLLLQLLRNTGAPHKVVTQNGLFQQNLPQNRTFQLLRLQMDPTLGLVPEISGNRLLFSVRLLQRGDDGRMQPCHDRDTEFEVTLCA